MQTANKNNRFDQRVEPRIVYSGHILFTAKSGLCEGRLKNYSTFGLFIETTACLSIGEIITIALPHLKGKNIKCKDQILWRNGEGCGIELFRKRSKVKFRTLK